MPIAVSPPHSHNGFASNRDAPRPEPANAVSSSAGNDDGLSEQGEKPKAREADPNLIARQILDVDSLKGLPLLRYWAGSWWKWERGRYAELSEAELRAKVLGHFKQQWSHVRRGNVTDVLEHLRGECILSSDVSPPTWLGGPDQGFAASDCLATKNRIVHLPSLLDGREIYSVEASPNLFTLTAFDFDLDPRAPRPDNWHTFLNQLWPDDQQSIDTLQELFGLLLTCDTRFQKLFAIIGPPRSGKGTIVRVLRKLLGECNVAGPTLASLGTNFGLAPLVGRPVAVIDDARLSGRNDQALVVERLLSISGEGKLTIDRKHAPAIHVQLPTRFLILSNELPRLPDASGTIVSRFIILRTVHSFLGSEDTELDRKLFAELPGILNWALDGLRRLREHRRFTQPKTGTEMLDSLERLASSAKAFAHECCDVRPDATCVKSDLYERFKVWCQSQGIERPPIAEMFSRDLQAAVPAIRTVRRRLKNANASDRPNCWDGITIRTNAVESEGLSQ